SDELKSSKELVCGELLISPESAIRHTQDLPIGGFRCRRERIKSRSAEGHAMADSKRGGMLTTLAILFAILALTDILKPLHLEGPTTGLVFLGERLSGTPDAILGLLLGIILLIYAAGIWRMSSYAMYLGYGYAAYVTLNLALFRARNPPPASQGEMIFDIVYIILALAFSWGTAIVLNRRKADLR